jgi:cytochrome c-type biogenesis protein CcmH
MAVQPNERLADPLLEERARMLSQNIRCLVCQNQSIDDSNATLAKDLRALVREKLTAGATNDEIFDFLVDRYGDFILLNPPFKPSTYVLWYGPLIFLIVGLLMTVLIMKKSKRRASEKPLSQAERVSLSKLLEQKDKT